MAINLKRQNIVIFTVFSLNAFLLLLFIKLYGTNIPWGDEWDSLPLIDKSGSTGISFIELFSQHNEHRIVIPRLIMLANARLFSLNLKYQMYLTGVCLIFMTGICIWNHLKTSAPRFRWLAIIVPIVLCGFRQYQNLLWGFQISFILALLFPIIVFHLLANAEHTHTNYWQSAVALAAGIMGSFSSSQGLFVWPAAIMIIALQGKRKRLHLALWGIVGALVWAWYFHGYVRPEGHPALNFVIEHPVAGFRYFCTLIGNLVVWQEDVSFVAGFVFLAAFGGGVVAAVMHKRLSDFSFWIATGLFSLMTFSAITVGRAGFGIESAFASRYVTFSAVFLVSVVSLLSGLISSKAPGNFPAVLYAITIIILIAIPFSYLQGWKGGIFLKGEFSRMSYCLRNYRIMPAPAMEFLYIPDSSVVKERAPILEKLGHEIFR